MKLAELSRLVAQLDGVSERRRAGLLDWRYRGRLVARQLDDGPRTRYRSVGVAIR